MKFRCRMVKPNQTAWFEVEAETWEDAVQDLHFYSFDRAGISVVVYPEQNPFGDHRLDVNLALMEAEGHGQVVTRVFHSGIYRKGGVRPHYKPLNAKLKEVADVLGWEHEPLNLIEPNWDLESDSRDGWEARSNRKYYPKADSEPDQFDPEGG